MEPFHQRVFDGWPPDGARIVDEDACAAELSDRLVDTSNVIDNPEIANVAGKGERTIPGFLDLSGDRVDG